ncbi:MAG TPA: acyl-CoA dehydratase activase [bacterium]|nr:acyl-CoA dehydratase activase [bacterium]HPY14674.1 acyl-CoA dehydratase activase [bacterium]HRQ70458.1 acyl-CoA dehydratase activase [bacterium]
MNDRLGIDIGTTFITVFSQNRNSVIVRKRHRGKAASILKKIFGEAGTSSSVKFTGKSAKEFSSVLNEAYIPETTAINNYLKKHSPFMSGSGTIIDIGASSLTKYVIKNNAISDISSNSLCAAGTGLFLEEQAERLGIDLEKASSLDIDDPPNIASRCTVFAKSDLIHHQQEGRTKDEMWAGMCKALAVSAANTLFKGAEIKGEIAIIGGVSMNCEVVRWFKKLFPLAFWVIPENSEAITAIGAMEGAVTPSTKIDLDSFIPPVKDELMPPLKLRKSKYPDFIDPSVDVLKNEIRIHSDISKISDVIIGMDIGSTSTKIAMLSTNGTPLLDIYRKTEGDPVNASKKIFKALFSLINPIETKIVSFGTTGSGRKLVGEIFGADAIVNEITAHGRGAASFFPEVETIFEIGGQDAKYIRMKNGFVNDVNMNYVCAAGTGSFVEEQSRKLDIPVQNAGTVTENIAPPVTSDRCTVFMEQDIRSLLKQGYMKEEVLASVLYSVTKNYLNRVVGNRKISRDKIFFQGATARNKGLVAAFENLLDVEVVVSPFCHVMGCIGAALIAYDEVTQGAINHAPTPLTTHDSPLTISPSRFIGPDSVDMEVTSRTEICKLCNNLCRINFIKRNGADEFSWGYMCGREPGLDKRKEIDEFRMIRERNREFYKSSNIDNAIGRIGIPMALSMHTYYPLWLKMFEKLNIKIEISSTVTSARIKAAGSKYSSSDFCFPMKASIGHAAELIERKIPIFFPSMIAAEQSVKTAISFFCPYVESAPSVIISSLEKNGIDASSYILDPVIDLRLSVEKNSEYIFNKLKKLFPVTKKEVVKAFGAAYSHFIIKEHEQTEKGENYLAEMTAAKKPVFLLVGRPYNLYDKGINLGIPETVASMGYAVVPMDMLELDTSGFDKTNYWNLFWNYGQKIIAALKMAASNEMLFPIYLTNFSCGPDSFILSYAEEEMKGRPMLILELDEHDSDGGYRTRIEAYIDVVKGYLKNKEKSAEKPMPDEFLADRPLDKGKVWTPPMHRVGTPLFAAAFRGYGYDSEPLPPETRNEFNLGKRYTRGAECLPMTLTLGAILNQAQLDPSRKHILFMPTSEGPCRFGQYNLLERIAFHNAGITNIDLMSPSSINSYQGLEEPLRRYLMHAMMSSDIMMKLLTKTRPYEKTKGDTDTLFAESVKLLEKTLEKKDDPKPVIKEITKKFKDIPKFEGRKPLVGIVGEIYARCNDYANGNIIEVIEKNGGEAWLSPMHEWILYTAWLQNYMAKQKSFSLFEAGESLIKNIYLFRTESAYYKSSHEVLHDRHEPPVEDVVTEGMKYLPPEFSGEAILTVGRTVMFAKEGASMVVNIAPFGCMHGTITDSIFQEIKTKHKMAILSQFYDGDIDINDKVADMLAMMKK